MMYICYSDISDVQFLAWFDDVDAQAQEEENKCYRSVTYMLHCILPVF